MDANRILDKMRQGRKYCEELSSILPGNALEFKTDLRSMRSGERYFEILAQVILDICMYITSNLAVTTPSTYASCIEALVDQNILGDKYRVRFVNLIKLRNLVTHRYGDLDHDLLYTALSHLCEDYQVYCDQIEKWVSQQQTGQKSD